MYQGGKSRLAKKISEAILADTNRRGVYVEPFLGGASVAIKMIPHFAIAELSDGMPDLVAMWEAARDGWIPPTEVTLENYKALKNAPVSELRGFVGFGCSFGGKWFGGYARGKGRNYAAEASRSVVRYAEVLKDSPVRWQDYRDARVSPGSVVYLDPPYEQTTSYAAFDEPFDSREFWRTAEKWAEDSVVYVSEFTRPSGDWTPVLEFERALGTSGVAIKGQRKRQVKEGLYRLGSN